jgi:hypothetical protein
MKRLPTLTSYRFLYRGALILGVGLLVIPSAASAARPPQKAGLVSPRLAVLRLSDVTHFFGAGFARSSAGPLKRINGAAVDALFHTTAYAKLARDWVSGYSVEYSKSVSLTTAQSVKSSVNLYKTSGSAQHAMQTTYAARAPIERHAGGGFYTSTFTRYSGVGQYAELSTNIMKPAKGGKPPALPGAYQYQLTFTRGHYDASLKIASASKVSMSVVLAVARVLDSRLHGG